MRHRPVRRLLLWRRCRCGAGWPCPDAYALPVPPPARSLGLDQSGWNGPTEPRPIVAADRLRLTPAQRWRGNGGRYAR
jgi:hypothetical protein